MFSDTMLNYLKSIYHKVKTRNKISDMHDPDVIKKIFFLLIDSINVMHSSKSLQNLA